MNFVSLVREHIPLEQGLMFVYNSLIYKNKTHTLYGVGNKLVTFLPFIACFPSLWMSYFVTSMRLLGSRLDLGLVSHPHTILL